MGKAVASGMGRAGGVQMAFPPVERVLYGVNPLEEVKCQLRFPSILLIDTAAPVAFQEAVRNDFPYYQLKSTVKLPANVPPNLASLVERDLSLGGSKSHVFSSADRAWTLTLTKDGLSLAWRQYMRWEQFRSRLEAVVAALVAVYRPAFFLHTCLRYRNAIRRSPLGLSDRPWSALLQTWIGGPLHQQEVSNDVESMQTKYVLHLPDGIGRVEANCGLGVHQPSKEVAFVIEAHIYHEEPKATNDVFSHLDAINQQARWFFRWCITDELHWAMRPVPLN